MSPVLRVLSVVGEIPFQFGFSSLLPRESTSIFERELRRVDKQIDLRKQAVSSFYICVLGPWPTAAWLIMH